MSTGDVPEADEISYMALAVGTPVESSSGSVFGKVEHVLQVPSLDLFDGIVVSMHHGLRHVERDQIARITRTVVQCSLSDEEVANLPPPDGTPVFHVDALAEAGPALTARLGRMFRREHWLKEE